MPDERCLLLSSACHRVRWRPFSHPHPGQQFGDQAMRSASSYYIIPAQIARSQISFGNYFMNLWLRRTNTSDFSFLSPPDKFTMLLSLTVLSLARSCSLLSSPLLVLVYWTRVVPLDLRYMVFKLPTICIHFEGFLSKDVFKMFFKRQCSCWLTDLASYTATVHGTLPH